MTATSAGSSSCLPAKGLNISLAALQRQDPYINNIMDVASQVALYTYNNRANEWEKTEVEGTLFIYTRLASPRHGFTIMNRLSMENLTEPITKDLDFQLQHPFLLYRNARLVIYGIWFYDKEDCQRIAQRMKTLTQQEQVLAQSQGGCFSLGGAGSEAKAVDIIQMLTKARTEYEKGQSTSEPKEIGGSSILRGNPNLIKPIPVKPNAQDNECAEPKVLTLATLFGSQHHHSPKPDPLSPLATPLESSSAGLTRPPVARTLTYEDVCCSKGVASTGGVIDTAGPSDKGQAAVMGSKTLREDGENDIIGLLPSSTAAQHQQNQPQHCLTIQKLMQGQRVVSGVVGVLQPLSESPENRLCDNGVPLEHHHHHLLHHHHHHQEQHHPHHHHCQQQQLQLDPIKRLFQTHPLPPSSSSPLTSTASLCCSNTPLQQKPHLSSQPMPVDSVSCSNLRAQQSQQLCFNLSKPQAETEHSSQSASMIEGTGQSTQMPGVVSPHELLQKLQLVQQEQPLASHDPHRPCPSLAPRFLGPNQSPVVASAPNLSSALQIQVIPVNTVISPQRIPATVAPNLLLSPRMFTQSKAHSGLTAVGRESSLTLPKPPPQEEIRVLSRSQLQATLLNLIKTDSSFLDTIYEAYISQTVNRASNKY